MSEGLTIEGVDVVVVEEIPAHSIQYLLPGHKWNPGDCDVLACNLETYVSLETIVLARLMAEEMVREAKLAKEARRSRGEAGAA
jgi:hypothetical protein